MNNASIFRPPSDMTEMEPEYFWEAYHGRNIKRQFHKSWLGAAFKHSILDYFKSNDAELIYSLNNFGNFYFDDSDKAKTSLKEQFKQFSAPPNYFLHIYKYKACMIKVSADSLSLSGLDRLSVTVISESKAMVEILVEELIKFQVPEKERESRASFGILYSDCGELTIKDFPLDRIIELDLAMNYGKSFPEKHSVLISKLSERKNGLYLLHGTPGSGKTTYIKYLAQELAKTGKRFIFIPTNQIDSLTNPNIIPLLLENKNAILILEDAEQAIISRESGGNPSIVSTLLNFSDGILGSMLGISLLVTFNTSKENVDSALKRKGRLMFEHQFGPLSIEESKLLATRLGKKGNINKDMVLSDIYNLEDDNFATKEESRKIGFGA